MLDLTSVLNLCDDPVNSKTFFYLRHFINILMEDVHIVESLPPSHKNVKPLEKAPVSWPKVC